MTLRFGDLVLRKKDRNKILFRINKFIDKKILLQCIEIPVYTLEEETALIKIKDRTLDNIPWTLVK